MRKHSQFPKITIEDLARPISEKEMKNGKKRMNISFLLGILPIDYDTPGRDYEIVIPSNYRTEHEYENDKSLADSFIFKDMSVPKDLANKLIAARRDLEKRGLKEPIDEKKIRAELNKE